MFGGSPQRDGWAKDESTLTPENVKNLKLDWKLKLNNTPRELTSLSVPVVMDQVITNHGFREIVIVAGSSDTLTAIDAESGKELWTKQFTASEQPKNKPHWLCPNALNATPLISRSKNGTVYTVSADGKLHALSIVNGEDRFPPKQFVPPFSKPWSLNSADDVLYTTVSQGCNGAKSGVYAMDLHDPQMSVSFFQSSTAGAGLWGRGGPAIGSNGKIFGETGDGPYDTKAGKWADSFLALSPKDLKLVDYYTPKDRVWITRKDLDLGNSTPVVFPVGQKEFLVGGGKEGSLFLLDTSSLGGPTHDLPAYRTSLVTNEDVDFAGRGFWGGFASWKDASGARWIFAPAWGPKHTKAAAFPITNGDAPNGSIMAFKVEEQPSGNPKLVPAWISRDLNVPEPPVIANGIVFAISSGEDVRQAKPDGTLYTSKDRAEGAVGNATLYAFDAATGKELFSSGKIMSSFTHFGGIGIANGRVLVTTYDSTVYAFGLGNQ